MKYANWNVPERGAEIPRALLAAGCTPLLAAILHLRGLSDPAAARSFLRGGAETLTNPLELTGMVDAVQRLTRAVATGDFTRQPDAVPRRYSGAHRISL